MSPGLGFGPGYGSALGLGLVLALAPAAACKGDAACTERLAAMRASFEAIPPGASSQPRGPLEGEFPLPTSARGDAMPASATVLRIAADGVLSFDGEARVTDAPAALAGAAERLAMPGQDRALYLAIAPTAPLAPHRVMLRRLAEQSPLRVLVRAPAPAASAAAPTPSPALAARLATLANADPSTRAQGLAEALKAAGSRCRPIDQAFTELASVAPAARQATLLNAVLTGAESCGCASVEVDDLSALVWALLVGDGPPPRWLPLQPAADGAKLAADAKGADLARLLEAGPAVALAD